MAMRVKIRPPKIRAPQILPRRPEIIVGIPTYNEEENISNITKTVDSGLSKYFPDKKALIINVDSNSTDSTRKAFLSTRTKTPKQYLESPRGKGASLKQLFGYFLGVESATVLVIIDANVTTASSRWVRNLATPILKGFDHVFPAYNNHEYDASVTNHFCYPVIRGVLGVDLRHPVVGETAMSRKAVDRLYNRAWPPAANYYGIDVLAALSSIFGELRIAQAYLGECKYDVDTERLAERFEHRAATLFEKLDKRVHVWKNDVPTRRPPYFFKGNRMSKIHTAKVDYKALNEFAIKEFAKNKANIKKIIGSELYRKLSGMFKSGAKLSISAEAWAEIVFIFVKASKVSPARRAKALRPLYFGRFVTFYREFMDKSHTISDRAIVEQAELFFKKRGVLTS
ncbi:MAG: hypothetical protein A3I33_01865 [Candidatus Colwellbacteria bacterium RIFCSPLOWO2_02_FULL_45_11]|uniref:Glycosyltransferase 2-like domain-containing protein n=1 Tax=Candidatus Colwellbacteria bacterium RIFCSPLOWO2_02_FULL_45_11 TaxID=1797692 RepID=A0A1G1Z8B7_9BACT|nr:MAG: hypothetical protein A3I33_01865 [Candidatus Colwellbacteria bacterium RIFCSPLOWO2_02_FULL_45_11]